MLETKKIGVFTAFLILFTVVTFGQTPVKAYASEMMQVNDYAQFAQTNTSYIEPFDVRTVDIHKKWIITFKEEVSLTGLSDKVYVTTDSEGTKKVTGISVVVNTNNPRQIEVCPPSIGYNNGEFYLFVKQGILSSKGNVLKESVRMRFIVEDTSNDSSSNNFGYVKDNFKVTSNAIGGVQQDIILPVKYDLRTDTEKHKLSTIKDQGDLGNCWAFATYGSLESAASDRVNNPDYSEQNLKNVAGNWFDFGVNQGGNRIMATAYLTAGAGPVLETDDVYVNNDNKNTSATNLPVQLQISDVFYVPDKDIKKIKEAIYNYGALYSSLHYDRAYLNTATSAYYYDGKRNGNHAINIVGWDDAYSKDKFKGPKPKNNGAFIIRNSWGTGWGEQGYFYVSYEDSRIGEDNALFNVDSVEKYDSVYQYDQLGCTYFTNNSTSTIWFTNIFEITSNEKLEAVGFYTATENTPYKVYINTDFQGNLSSGLRELKSGLISQAGFHTVKLDSPVTISADKKMQIAVKFSLPGNLIAYVAIEKPCSGFSSQARGNAGESYTSNNGNNWYDITNEFNNTNVCLKAYFKKGLSSLSKEALLTAINTAQSKYNSSIEGTLEGQYKPGSKAELKAAIDAANTVYNGAESTQEKVDEAVIKINDAVTAFEKNKIGTVSITSIADINKTVNQNAKYNLPVTVSATMSNGSSKDVDVSWDKTADTSKAGTITYYGTVAGYNKAVKLYLTINPVATTILSIADINETITQNATFILPAKVSAKMNDGSNQDIDVSWDPKTADTSKAGTTIYYGTVVGYNNIVKLYLTVNPGITSIDDISKTLSPNVTFVFPSKVNAKLSDGSTKSVDVTWDNYYINTTEAGTRTYYGTVPGYSKVVKMLVTITGTRSDRYEKINRYISSVQSQFQAKYQRMPANMAEVVSYAKRLNSSVIGNWDSKWDGDDINENSISEDRMLMDGNDILFQTKIDADNRTNVLIHIGITPITEDVTDRLTSFSLLDKMDKSKNDDIIQDDFGHAVSRDTFINTPSIKILLRADKFEILGSEPLIQN